MAQACCWKKDVARVTEPDCVGGHKLGLGINAQERPNIPQALGAILCRGVHGSVLICLWNIRYSGNVLGLEGAK
jgi:hypothetical protein